MRAGGTNEIMMMEIATATAGTTQQSDRTATDRFMSAGRNQKQGITHSGSLAGGDLVVVEEEKQPQKIYLR